jgi:hypothetical protein
VCPSEPAQTEFGAVIVVVFVPEPIDTVFVQTLLQPVCVLVTVSVSVNEPEAPAVTMTFCWLLAPLIEPLPEIDQA